MSTDVDWVVSTARSKDPSLDHDVAVLLAAAALAVALDGHDAPAVARALMDRHPDVDVSAANVVAVAAVERVAP